MANANCTGMSTTMSRRVLRTAGQKLASVTMRCTNSSVKPWSPRNASSTPCTIGQPNSRAMNTSDGAISSSPDGPLRARRVRRAGASVSRSSVGAAITRPRRPGRPGRGTSTAPSRRRAAPRAVRPARRAPGARAWRLRQISRKQSLNTWPTCASRLPSPTGGSERIASRLPACAFDGGGLAGDRAGQVGGQLHRRHGEERVLPQRLHLHARARDPADHLLGGRALQAALGQREAREDEHVAAALGPARGGHHQPVVRLVLRGADEPGHVVPRHQHLAAGQRLLHVFVVGGRGRRGRPEVGHVGPRGLGVGAAERRNLPAGEAGQQVALGEAVEQPLGARRDAEHRAARRRLRRPRPGEVLVVGELADVGARGQPLQGLLVDGHDVGRLHPRHELRGGAAQRGQLEDLVGVARARELAQDPADVVERVGERGEVVVEAADEGGAHVAGLGLRLDRGGEDAALDRVVRHRHRQLAAEHLLEALPLLDGGELGGEEPDGAGRGGPAGVEPRARGEQGRREETAEHCPPRDRPHGRECPGARRINPDRTRSPPRGPGRAGAGG